MPIKRAAKKALRQAAKAHQTNLVVKAEIRKLLKKTKTVKGLPPLQKAIDKAAAKGIIPKRKAARIKSQVSRKLNQKPTLTKA